MSSEKTVQTFALVGDWVTIPDIAEALDLKVTRVHNLISDGTLVALREPDTNVRKVPALFLNGDHVLESLKGTLVVLKDAGFSDEEAITWLYTAMILCRDVPLMRSLTGRRRKSAAAHRP